MYGIYSFLIIRNYCDFTCTLFPALHLKGQFLLLCSYMLLLHVICIVTRIVTCVLLRAFWKVCFHPGVRLDIAGNVRVYPYAGDKYEMRTSEATRQHALIAQLSGKYVSAILWFCRPCNNANCLGRGFTKMSWRWDGIVN